MTREEVIEGINDKLKDLKYYAKEMEEVLKSTNYFINELEKQVKKVEPKPKAYHVKDKYSFNCLMKELNENFLFVHLEENYIYEKDCDGRKYYYWTEDFEEIKDTHEVIEYHKKQPKYLLQSNLKGDRGTQYFGFDRNKNRKFFASELFGDDKYTQIFTKEEAEELQKENAYAALCEMVEVE